MASVVTDVSSKLGEYMLKGWILTEKTCSNENCHVPLMRSPMGQRPENFFCANCDRAPSASTASTSSRLKSRPKSSSPPSSPITAQSSSSFDSKASRSSTPATDLPGSPNSATFVLPPISAETLRRRQQSDAASAEIASRLLSGWAMLADECPNRHCCGVPLVRPPLSGVEKSLRKECVACGNVYVDEGHGLALLSEQIHGHSALNSEVALSSTAKLEAASPTRQKDTLKKGDKIDPSNTGNSLDVASESLEVALTSLSYRLTTQSTQGDVVDVTSIGATADAMGKVAHALETLNRLRS